MGKPKVSMEVQAAAAQCSLQSQKESRIDESDKMQRLGDSYVRANVARWPARPGGEEDSRKSAED